MTAQPSPTTRLQERLLARLIGAIYGIVDVLIPIIETVATKPGLSWRDRTSVSARFWAIIRELNALTLRIGPATLSENPVFPETRPHNSRAATIAPATRVTAGSRSSPPPTGRSLAPIPLTPRQLARRLAILLGRLECLAAEAGAALTAAFHRHAAKARAIAGCNALPPPRNPTPHASWERAG